MQPSLTFLMVAHLLKHHGSRLSIHRLGLLVTWIDRCARSPLLKKISGGNQSSIIQENQ